MTKIFSISATFFALYVVFILTLPHFSFAQEPDPNNPVPPPVEYVQDPNMPINLPSDIRVAPTSDGYYTIKVLTSKDEDVAKVCVERMDTGSELDCHPAGPNQVVTFTVNVLTNIPADLPMAAYIYDNVGNKSTRSFNLQIIDFTPPGPGTLLR
jgi:hypothetical protein